MRLAAVTLAAGLSTRMKSATPKILHKILGKPIIQYVIESLARLSLEKSIVVIRAADDEIKNTLKSYSVIYAVQNEPKGTADALNAALLNLQGFSGIVLVVNGDTPLITSETLKELIELHQNNSEDISIITFTASGTHSYGRILRENGNVKAIVENRDANQEQKKITEANGGIYVFSSHMPTLLNEIKINESKGEYYLTDIVDLGVKKGYRVGAHNIASEEQLIGINTREDLHKALHYLKNTIAEKWLQNGVSILDKNTVFIHPDVEIGTDTIIYPNVHIEGRSLIGANCTIYPNTRIADSMLADGVVIKDSSVIESSEIKENTVVGPFAHIRPGCVIGPSSKIGNFVEIKKSVLGAGVKASHLSYLGDSEIGSNVNVGAGTITCNYDGKVKHKTIIQDEVFIGSDTQLVAPVKVGKGSYIGAGSTITKDVPPLSLAVSRAPQKNIRRGISKKSPKKSHADDTKK
jgi:bifunctional UDP-N-acetylglucosamine pyrophosphorylase/glucosamine-1-phosphate N-acetyltransferase